MRDRLNADVHRSQRPPRSDGGGTSTPTALSSSPTNSRQPRVANQQVANQQVDSQQVINQQSSTQWVVSQ